MNQYACIADDSLAVSTLAELVITSRSDRTGSSKLPPSQNLEQSSGRREHIIISPKLK